MLPVSLRLIEARGYLRNRDNATTVLSIETCYLETVSESKLACAIGGFENFLNILRSREGVVSPTVNPTVLVPSSVPTPSSSFSAVEDAPMPGASNRIKIFYKRQNIMPTRVN